MRNQPGQPPASLDFEHSKKRSVFSQVKSLVTAGVDIVTIKNILGHVSIQTTQIYAEMSQDTVDQKLKEWNETWFGKKEEIQSNKSEDYPVFLKCK